MSRPKNQGSARWIDVSPPGASNEFAPGALDRMMKAVAVAVARGELQGAAFPEASHIFVVSPEVLERMKADGWQEDGVR